MKSSRRTAKFMCFAFIAALFLLINAFLESGSTLTALAVAAVQVVLFVLVNLFFNVKSRTKKRMILKYVISAIGIFAVTITFLGVFFNDNYSMYMFDGEETGSSFLDTTVDTTPRLVYAFLQLLPVLMYAAIAFKRAYLFPAASAFAAFGIIANNTSMAFGPFSVVSAKTDSVREYVISSFSDKIAPAMAILVIVSLVVSVCDLIMYPPKKKLSPKNIILAGCYLLAVIFCIIAVVFQLSGKTFDIEALKVAVYSSNGLF